VGAPSVLSNLAGEVLFTRDPLDALRKICEVAAELTGARNAMIARYDDDLGYMKLIVGIGQDWNASMLGNRINVGIDDTAGITAYVAATGESFRSGDVTAEARYKMLIESSRSELAAPVFDVYRRVCGVLNLESNELDKFSEQDEPSAELLAVLAGLALARESWSEREEALLAVGSALDGAATEEDLLQEVSAVTQRVLRVSAYSIFLWDDREQAFVLRNTGGSSNLDKDARYKPGEGCTGWVCQHGESIRLHDPQSDPRWRGVFVEFPADQVHSYVAVPILSGGRVLGAMRALRKKGSNPYIDNRFTESDQQLLEAIADQLGTGLEKLRSIRRLVSSERMAAWGELSARSSHMIGNRVFALSGDINELRFLLSDESPNTARALEVVEDLGKGVERIEAILQDYRDFVTATKLTMAEGDLTETVESAAMSVVPSSGKVSVVIESTGDLSRFHFDSQKVERAVSELIENATHYMPEGVVTVRVGPADADDFVRANMRPRKKAWAKIEVEDQGEGVAVDLKRTIFDAYYSSRAKGMGLGLSIVKGIIDAHDGKIYEAGQPGEGAKFVLLIPMRVSANGG
jgi:signal transduction histidine kinase